MSAHEGELQFEVWELRAKNEQLKKENEALKEELRLERGVVDFYAKEPNWITKMLGVCDLIRDDDLDQLEDSRGIDWNIGGKRARQRQRERKEGER